MNPFLFVIIALLIILLPLIYAAGYSYGILHGLDLALKIEREISEYEHDLK